MATDDLLQSVENKKDYFLLTLKGLRPSTAYPVQLRWQKKDDSRGLWSASKVLDTPGESDVAVPSDPVVSTDPGIIAVSWDGKDSLGTPLLNFDRVEISIIDDNNTFASVDNIAGSFKSKGYLSIPVKAGIYSVQLRTVTALGTKSSLTEPAQTITVEGGIQIDPPKLPTGVTATSAAFGIAVSWAGTYQNNETFGGFKAINIYASTSDLGSSTTTMQSSKLVGTMVVDVTVNKITIGLESLKQALSLTSSTVYTTPIYLYYIATNQKDSQYSVNGTPTYTRINSTGISPTKANIVDLANGLISIENLVAGNGQFTSWLRTGTAGGARIELNGGNSFIDNGHSVLPGFTVYDSGSEPLFRATLDGTVTFGTYAPSDLDAISADASTGKSSAALALLKGQNFDSDGNISKGIAIPSATNPGSIYSIKSAYSRDDLNGWFLGWSGSHPVVSIGNLDSYLKWTTDSTLEVKGTIKGSTFSITDSFEDNYWNASEFVAGNSTSYIHASTSNGASITLRASASQPNDNSAPGSQNPAYSSESKISLTSGGVRIYGIQAQGDADIVSRAQSSSDPHPGYRKGKNGEDLYPLGAAGRQRMIIQSEYTGELLRGMAVYYGQITNAPTSGTGAIGDLWVSW